MSIKLSKGECIVKTYDYATVRSGSLRTSKSLIVTNKRIIHKENASSMGNEQINSVEMPVESAKYVNIFYGMKRHPVFLVLGIIFAMAAIALFFLLEATLRIIAGASCGVFAVLFILLFVFLKKKTLTCEILSEKPINFAIGFSGKTSGRFTQGIDLFGKAFAKKSTVVVVNNHVAKAMAEELGAVIADAASGEFEVEEPQPDDTAAFDFESFAENTEQEAVATEGTAQETVEPSEEEAEADNNETV